MKHTIEQIENFINDELERKGGFINKTYRYGYKQAIIDIKNIILDNQIENLVGKYGFFWDMEDANSCIYGKLTEYRENEEYPYENNNNFKYKCFSLIIPKHLNK
jgi:hypothetical protein